MRGANPGIVHLVCSTLFLWVFLGFRHGSVVLLNISGECHPTISPSAQILFCRIPKPCFHSFVLKCDSLSHVRFCIWLNAKKLSRHYSQRTSLFDLLIQFIFISFILFIHTKVALAVEEYNIIDPTPGRAGHLYRHT